MEQRKLNDQANTLVDLAKVSRHLKLFQHPSFENEEFVSENVTHCTVRADIVNKLVITKK